MRTLAIALFGAWLSGAALISGAAKPSLALLVHQLKGEERKERVEAALALEALGPAAVVAAPELVAALKFRPTRAPAGRALVHIGPATVPVLFAALKKDDMPPAQREAIRRVLLRLGPRILPKLLEAARDFNTSLRNDALAVLGAMEPPPADAFPVLLDISLRPRLWIGLPAAPSLDQIMIDLGQDDGLVIQNDDYSAYLAASALSRCGPKAIPFFLRALEDDRWQVPVWLVDGPALARHFVFGGWGAYALREPVPFQEWLSQQIPTLREWRDPRRHTRQLALRGLSNLREADSEAFAEQVAARILPSVARALKDKDIGNRLAAARLLQDMGPAARPAIPALVEALKDTSYIPPVPVGLQSQSSLPLYAAMALQEIGPEGMEALAQKGLPILTDQLRDRDPLVRDYALLALAVLEERARPIVSILVEELIHHVRARRDAEKIKDRRFREAPAEFYYYCNALQHIGAAVPDLLKLLAEDDPEIRQLALTVLERMGERGKAAVPALIALLREKETTENRWGAVRALGAMGRRATSATAALRKACADKDADIVLSAALALHEVDPWSPEPALVLGHLIGESGLSSQSKVSYLQQLAKWGRKARPAASDLTAVLHREIDQEDVQWKGVQREAAVALCRIDPEQKATAALALARLMKAGDAKAALALADLDPGHGDLASALSVFLRETKDRKEHFLDALGRAGAQGRSVLPILLDHLKGDSGWQALTGLEKMGPPAKKALPALLDAVETWDEHRLELIDTLVTIAPGAPEVHAALVKLLEEPDDADCDWSAGALGRIGAPARSAVPRLKALLEHPRVRLSAAEALVKITGQKTPYVDVIVNALGGRRDLQLAAVNSVARLGNRAMAAVPALRTILKKSTDPELLETALEALAVIGRDAYSAQREVIPLLQNNSYHVRRVALKALGEFADVGAMPSLAVFIEENERSLAEEAEKARDRVRLRQMGRGW